jgi:hypothetical protein
MPEAVPPAERLNDSAAITRGNERLRGLADAARAEVIRNSTSFTMLSSVIGTLHLGDLPSAKKSDLRSLPKRPRAETLEDQTAAFVDAVDHALKAGILKPPQVFEPISTSRNMIVNVLPVVHSTDLAVHPNMLDCQTECYRLVCLMQRFGVSMPTRIEGGDPGMVFGPAWTIGTDLGEVLLDSDTAREYLYANPRVLKGILNHYRLPGGRNIGFENLLQMHAKGLATQRQKDVWAIFDRDDLALYGEFQFGTSIAPEKLELWFAAAERMKAIIRLMNQECVSAVTGPDAPPFQRVIIGGMHRDDTARMLQESGCTVWITEPAHVPNDVEDPRYTLVKNYFDAQKK